MAQALGSSQLMVATRLGHHFTIPNTIGMLIMALYRIVDTFWVTLLGEQTVAPPGLSSVTRRHERPCTATNTYHRCQRMLSHTST